MLPGSLLRYHEKIHGTVAGAVDVRAFCLSVGTRLKLGQAQGLMLGQMLAQELQGAVLTRWVMLSLNIYIYIHTHALACGRYIRTDVCVCVRACI